MCRLFAVHSSSPVRVEQAFATLRQQALEHRDGWGVAVFGPGGPEVETALESAAGCSRFLTLGHTLTASHLLAHLRLASVGSVAAENAHPFRRREFAFMHNGTVRRFGDRRHLLLSEISQSQRQQIAGKTDSEACFAYFLTQIENLPAPSLEQLAAAIAKTMRRVVAVFDENLGDSEKPANPSVTSPGEAPSALNFVVSDGRRLVASCLGRTLFHLQDRHAHYVSSEPLWNHSTWTPMTDRQLLLIDEDLSSKVVDFESI